MDEFTVRSAPSTGSKRYNVFKLHKDDNVNWKESKMRRENDYQPWQIKFGSGRTARRFKAIKEGGVGDNASYFVFYKSSDKSATYEVCPVEEWYSVSATQRYKTLTAEEAEQKFEQRHKMLNLFSVMHLKKSGENGDEAGSHESKAFKVSELDDWDDSGSDEASEDGDEDGDNAKKKSRRKKSVKKEKDEPDDAPDEAKEESDEGDFEQREVDYMSDTSSSSSDSEGVQKDDRNAVKGIAEEEALRDLLSTDDEEDGENAQRGSKSNTKKTALGTVDFKTDLEGDGSDDSSDSEDYDVDDDKIDSMFSKKGLPAQLSSLKQEIKQEVEPGASVNYNASTSGNATSNRQAVSTNKRKIPPEVTTPVPSQPPPKKPCPVETSSSPANGPEKIVEDLVRKYLSRKPMPLKILLKDVKSKLKKTENVLLQDSLVNTIAAIMKRLSPVKQKVNDVSYFYLES